MNRLYAEVAVNSSAPHRQTFSYAVPEGMDVRPGHAVYIPFGRLTLQGIVLEVHGTPVFSDPEKIRDVRSKIGDAPLLDPPRVRLARWLADHYIAPVFEAVALLLPPGFARKPLTRVRALVDAEEVAGLDLPPRLRDALAIIAAAGPSIDTDALRDRHGVTSADGIVAQLEKRGYVVREYTMARPSVTEKTVDIARLALPARDARAMVERESPPRASRRAALLERLVEKRTVSEFEAVRLAGSRANLERLLRGGGIRPDREGHNYELAIAPDEALADIARLRHTKRAAQALAIIDALDGTDEIDLPSLRARSDADLATVRWLADAGVIALDRRTIERDPLDGRDVARKPPPDLLPAQQAAADAIYSAIDARAHRTFLLHGVTGSGKTEVYLRALHRCVTGGRRGIVLVPEIALTPQTIRRFRERFERVAVLHSGLSDGELFDQWHGIAAGRYDVVVGARSALFAPIPEVGLIVIDEEHEWTYKQHDPPPRYHARESAIELARLCGAAVVLGSATPDVTTYERAGGTPGESAPARADFTLLTLPERVRPVARPDGSTALETSLAMPPVSVVDMRAELHAGNRTMFSRELTQLIGNALDHRDQVILFLNRRGLAGHVQCRDCGFVPACASCHVAMTYHRQYDRLVCHLCNRQQRMPATCRQCGSPRVRLVGAGVEKVEAEAARTFPGSRTLRWDRDVTRGRHAHEHILATFLAREADILIGTQMLAKGLDMPAVTVVGVVNADIGLHLPDFRAGERAFQLLTQVAGRAGRGERPGRVVLQTYQPDHYAIDAAARYDYEGFAERELDARRRMAYPPYARLVRLVFQHANSRFAREEAMRVRNALEQRRLETGAGDDIIGPSPAYVPRLRGRWRWQMIIRGRDPAALIRDFVLPPHWSVDVDPVTIA
jgi:primosomal protein N' (replication factor Y)